MAPELSVFYDHSCAFCRTEMTRIARWDTQARVRLIDFSAPGFCPAAYGLERAALDRELHGISRDGEVLRGMACVRQVYRLTRLGWLWRITALPGLRGIFDCFYLWFAHNRQAISAWLGYAKVCAGSTCRASSSRST